MNPVFDLYSVFVKLPSSTSLLEENSETSTVDVMCAVLLTEKSQSPAVSLGSCFPVSQLRTLCCSDKVLSGFCVLLTLIGIMPSALIEDLA